MNKLILLLAVVISASLFSCGKTDEPNTPTTPTADVTYDLGNMGDLIDMVDVTIEYTGADGKAATEVIKSKTWKKELKGVKTPFLAKATVTYVRKANFTAEDKKYNVSKGVEVGFKSTNGGAGIAGTFSIREMLTIAAVDSYLAKFINNPSVTEYINISGK